MSEDQISQELIKTPVEPSNEPVAPHQNPAEWAKQVFAHLSGARADLTDLAREQNRLLIKAIDEGIELLKSTPSPDLRDWAQQGLEALNEARQNIAQLSEVPREELIETARDVAATQVNQVVETATEYAGAGAAALLKARSQWLDFVSRKNDDLTAAVKEDLKLDDNSAAAALADFSREVVSNYVEIQRRWLELAGQLPFIQAHSTPAAEAAPPAEPVPAPSPSPTAPETKE
jgi:hypothetical protein